MIKIKPLLPVFFCALMSCSKSDSPSPATTNSSSNTTNPSISATVVKDQAISNSYIFGGSTYYTTAAAEETLTINGSYIYSLAAEDASANGVQFWFNQKPSVGTYSVVYATATIPSGSSVVGVTMNGLDYLSSGGGTVNVSINGSGNYVVTANNIGLINSVNTSQTQIVSASVTIP